MSVHSISQVFPAITDESGFQGISQAVYQDIKELPSVVVLEKFKGLGNILGIAVVGSSAAGKTTVVNSVRTAIAGSPDVVIPKRYITRPPRVGDDINENLYIGLPDLFDKVKCGEVTVSWVRNMEAGRTEYYGFEETEKKKLALYSANNDFFRHVDVVRQNILVLGVYAPDEIRKQRLFTRSPDMAAAEVAYRLGDVSDNIIPDAHILLKNFGETEQAALSDVCALVMSVVKHRVPWGEMKDLGDRRTVHCSRLFEIVEHDVVFSDGSVKTFEYAERSPGVRSLLIHDGKILLTKEWREEVGGWDYRLPGGKVFESAKEYQAFLEQNPHGKACALAAQKAAAREIGEEVGIEVNADDVQLSYISKCGTTVRWDLFYFCVELNGDTLPSSEMVTPEGEVIQNVWLSQDEVRDLCVQGQVAEDRTSNFLLRFVLKQQSQTI